MKSLRLCVQVFFLLSVVVGTFGCGGGDETDKKKSGTIATGQAAPPPKANQKEAATAD
jgi:hypothetical protein